MILRSRPTYAFLIAATLVLGLASRKFSPFLPWWMAKNTGDVLYATLAFWLIGFFAPTLTTLRVAIVTTLFCVGIEFLKFCTLPWLVAARQSAAGALVLGHGFHASNLVCYLLGIAIAVGIETFLKARPA
jgi:hypothetical protein